MSLLQLLDNAHQFLAEQCLVRATAELKKSTQALTEYLHVNHDQYSREEKLALTLKLTNIYNQASRLNGDQTAIRAVMLSIEKFKHDLLNPENLITPSSQPQLETIQEDDENSEDDETDNEIDEDESNKKKEETIKAVTTKKPLNPGWGKQSPLAMELLRHRLPNFPPNTTPANNSSLTQIPTPGLR